jgi:hypothetical protein
MECHLGMQHRKAKADKQLAPVMKDIAVMDGNGGGICAGEDLPNAEPHIAPLPHRSGIKPCAFHLIKQIRHAGAVVPKDRDLLRQGRKKAAGRIEISSASPIEAHRDMAYKPGLPKLGHDASEDRGLQIPRMAGQDKCKRRVLGQHTHLLLKAPVVGVPEPMKRCNRAVLVELLICIDEHASLSV